MTGAYSLVIEGRDGRPEGDPIERVSHTGHPRVGEHMQIGEHLYRVARVEHNDASPDPTLPNADRYRWTAPTLYVRPVAKR